MKEQDGGQIINVSSVAGQRPLPQMALYCASKSAVNFISRGLRLELRPYHITVSLVYPGRTLTEFGDARLGAKGVHPSPLGRVPAERVGQAIVKTVDRRRLEVYVTWYDWLFSHLNRLFPRTTDYWVGLVTRLA
jgi:short-subunit dehydrogenase